MGQFKIEILAVGGHGVDRDKKEGEKINQFVEGWKSPDAIAKICADALQMAGCNVESAVIVHWPGLESEITDNLLTGERSKPF